MSDLISRKAVMEYLSELCNTKDTSAYGLQLMGNYEAMKIKLAERDLVKSISENIYGFECAYDVDKAIQDLKDHSYKANEWNDETQSFDLPVIELDLAVRLVKGAVKDE